MKWEEKGNPFILRIDFAAQHLILNYCYARAISCIYLDLTAFRVLAAWKKRPNEVEGRQRIGFGEMREVLAVIDAHGVVVRGVVHVGRIDVHIRRRRSRDGRGRWRCVSGRSKAGLPSSTAMRFAASAGEAYGRLLLLHASTRAIQRRNPWG